MSRVQSLTIGPDDGDQRLNRWFRRQFPHVGQDRIEKMCRKDKIRLDGGRVKPATRVAVGQVVRVCASVRLHCEWRTNRGVGRTFLRPQGRSQMRRWH